MTTAVPLRHKISSSLFIKCLLNKNIEIIMKALMCKPLLKVMTTHTQTPDVHCETRDISEYST